MLARRCFPASSTGARDRGVSPVIGAVLMLAIAIVAMTVFQTVAIPAVNAQHEFQHSQSVQADLVDLETAVDRVAATGIGESVTVSLGLRYPPRLLFFNPPPVSGTLRSTTPRPVRIDNARAAGETGDFWNGSERSFQTTSLTYRAQYHEYDSAPETVYEPWVVYNRDGDDVAAVTQPDLIEGRTISLVALDGNYSRAAADRASVNVVPNSAPVNTVTIHNDTAPITLTIPTQLRNDTWTQLLAGELDQPGVADDRHVLGIDCLAEPPEPCGELTLTLEPGTYDLQLAEVALGAAASREPAAYLTDVEGADETVLETGRQRLVVEARDRFDNPVSGVAVRATLTAGEGRLRAVTPVTEEDGRAVFTYEAPANLSTSSDVTVTAAFGNGDARRNVTFDLRLIALGGQTQETTEPIGDDRIEPVEGSVESQNIGGADRGREASFAIRATEQITIEGFNVTTQNDLAGRDYIERDTTFEDSTGTFQLADLPRSVSGELQVAIRDIDASADLGISEFVSPEAADIVVRFELTDGSTITIGLG